MRIITSNEYKQAQQEFGHLFDICQPSPEMVKKDLDWVVRDGFSQAGTLLLGDLRVKKHESNVMEIHPFPEWVVQIKQFGKISGKVYVIIPKLTEKDLKKIARRDWAKRIERVQKVLDGLTSDDFLAIEYEVGIDIKIPANVPHDFISMVGEGEITPYCNVFEPNFMGIAEVLKVTTPYFTLKDTLKIE